MGLGSSQPTAYLQPGPSIAVGQGPFEEGRHVFNGDVNGIILLQLHLALLYGQAIDLDARNNKNTVCPRPWGLFSVTRTGRFAPEDMGSLRVLCQLRTQKLLQITGATHKGRGAVLEP